MRRRFLVRRPGKNCVVEPILTSCRGVHDGDLLPRMHDVRDNVLVDVHGTLSGLPDC